jgi:hypothetical protein
MLFSDETLIDLLAKRRDLYEKLGLIGGYVAPEEGGPAFGDSVIMGDTIEGLEGQVADINRRIARIRGPIPDRLAFDLD